MGKKDENYARFEEVANSALKATKEWLGQFFEEFVLKCNKDIAAKSGREFDWRPLLVACLYRAADEMMTEVADQLEDFPEWIM
jgi:hypothetical protein